MTMDNHPEKITIRPDELAEPAERITIRAEDLPVKVSKPPALPPKNPSAGSPPSDKDAPHRGSPLSRVLIFVPIVLLLLLIAGLPIAYWLLQNDPTVSAKQSSASNTWIENIAAKIDRSVVVVQSGPKSLGSGFVIASSGEKHLVLTNRHVVGEQTEFAVALRRRSVVEGVLVGTPIDPDVDLALILIEVPGLRPLGPIASFRKVKIGEPVVAVGHPLGLDFSVTDGIISAKRNGLELQTTAPISPGNSGGPLVDQRGHVVGVNTRIVKPSEANLLGFSIRADYVLDTDKWNYTEKVLYLVKKIPQ